MSFRDLGDNDYGDYGFSDQDDIPSTFGNVPPHGDKSEDSEFQDQDAIFRNNIFEDGDSGNNTFNYDEILNDEITPIIDDMGFRLSLNNITPTQSTPLPPDQQYSSDNESGIRPFQKV